MCSQGVSRNAPTLYTWHKRKDEAAVVRSPVAAFVCLCKEESCCTRVWVRASLVEAYAIAQNRSTVNPVEEYAIAQNRSTVNPATGTIEPKDRADT